MIEIPPQLADFQLGTPQDVQVNPEQPDQAIMTWTRGTLAIRPDRSDPDAAPRPYRVTIGRHRPDSSRTYSSCQYPDYSAALRSLLAPGETATIRPGIAPETEVARRIVLFLRQYCPFYR